MSVWVDYDFAVVTVQRGAHLYGSIPAGVLLHARASEFLDARMWTDALRLDGLLSDAHRGRMSRYLEAYLWIARGEDRGGPIALLPPSERFHWLTAPRSDLIRASAVHSGRTTDPAATLERLFSQYVVEP